MDYQNILGYPKSFYARPEKCQNLIFKKIYQLTRSHSDNSDSIYANLIRQSSDIFIST